MGLNIKIGKSLASYSLGIGLIYLVFGLLEFARGLSKPSVWNGQSALHLSILTYSAESQ
jgi:hypothetical protein